jgi:hypothetical protein
MNILKNIFGKKENLAIKSNADFWTWFQKNELKFHEVVKSGNNFEEGFFDSLSEKLNELKDGYYFLAGMVSDDIAELVLTADGNLNNIVFVEEIVNEAPRLKNWKFTAFKKAYGSEGFEIKMGPMVFNDKNIFFYENKVENYTDNIDITLVYSDKNSNNASQMGQGVCIYLENYIGELEFATQIDAYNVIGKDEAKNELIPISKIKEYLIWRQKEFNEIYDGIWYDSINDAHSVMEAELESGNMLLAVINSDLLNWENKASHPWIGYLIFKYDGSKTNGMPNESDFQILNQIEEEILEELKDIDGNLYIGRQTADGEREMYFACKDFRLASKIFYNIQQKYSEKFEIEHGIYKDKYWQSFNRFQKANSL